MAHFVLKLLTDKNLCLIKIKCVSPSHLMLAFHFTTCHTISKPQTIFFFFKSEYNHQSPDGVGILVVWCMVVIKPDLHCLKGAVFLVVAMRSHQTFLILSRVFKSVTKNSETCWQIVFWCERLSDTGLLRVFLKFYESLLVCGRH